jgi:hypothetical protein
MIMNKTQEIKQYFTEDRSFAKGLQLFNKYGRNMAFLQLLNRKGENEKTLAQLHYQLAKLGGISEREMKAILASPVMPTNPVEKVKLIPEEVVKSIKLRDEFPFLSNKDCPRELKILVNDMLTTYETYKMAHEELLDAAVEDEIKKLSADVVENFLENRQIWDELNHYKEKGEVLGEHPIFAQMERQDELAKMTQEDLILLERNLVNKINRTKAQIKKGDKPHLNQERSERIKEFEFDLPIVRRLLNING